MLGVAYRNFGNSGYTCFAVIVLVILLGYASAINVEIGNSPCDIQKQVLASTKTFNPEMADARPELSNNFQSVLT